MSGIKLNSHVIHDQIGRKFPSKEVEILTNHNTADFPTPDTDLISAEGDTTQNKRPKIKQTESERKTVGAPGCF